MAQYRVTLVKTIQNLIVIEDDSDIRTNVNIFIPETKR